MAFSNWIRNWKRSLERRWALHQALRRQSLAQRRAYRPRLEALEDRWLLSTVYTVTSTSDNGVAGTLRDAINQVNLGNFNEIDFNIGTTGSAQTISLTSQLPTLTASSAFINGLSQGGTGNTSQLITLNGTGAGGASDGLFLQGASNTISGLIIQSFGANGIEVDGANNLIGGTATGAGNIISSNGNAGVIIDSSISGVQVQGNYIGVDITGALAQANSIGVSVKGSNNTIGGTVAGARNVISGNTADGISILSSSNITVQGNYIGTNAAGTSAIANAIGILADGSNSTIGGTTAAARNIISGNSNIGVMVGSATVQVQGNYIGTDVSGTKGVGNSIGVETVAPNNTIGGTLAGAGNVISGNSDDGVFITGASGAVIQGNLIGTDFSGTTALANSIGVEVDVAGQIVGGTLAGAANVISGNTSAGVLIDVAISGVQVQGNLIGTDITGASAVGNSIGVEAAGSLNTIGGTSASTRNIISGNKGAGVRIDLGISGIQVQGNYIGTNVSGTVGVGNSVGVEAAGSNNTIGGTSASTRNIISGNTNAGVLIDSSISGIQVQGNYIGTNSAGTAAVGNSVGVFVQGSTDTIGGTAAGAGNVISGNTNIGVSLVTSASIAVQGNFIGTNAGGTGSVGNSVGISANGSNGTIGGTTATARNVISGNTNIGVLVGSPTVQVIGNYIGTNSTGAGAVGNSIGVETTAPNITLGGTATGAGNLISGNSNAGVLITGSSGVVLQGNLIGTDASGTVGVGNSIGVEVSSSGNVVGGSLTGARNIISGNSGDGVLIDTGVSGVQVQGNYIGTDITGATAVANSIGVEVDGSDNTIGGTTNGAGNVISGNSDVGVIIVFGASGVQVQGNSIGTDATGSTAIANAFGVEVYATNNTVGGTTTAARNIISGNTEGVYVGASGGVTVQGNFIGTDVTGSTAVANGTGVEINGSDNTLGGAASGARNVISGNSGQGVFIDGGTSGIQVQGNYIGTDVTGATSVANLNGLVANGSNNTIGGTAIGARNIISGNTSHGVEIDASAVQVQGNYIGTDVTGSSAVGNGFGVYVNTALNTIGGTASGEVNVISGNITAGVLINGSAVQVVGNYIGTDATGANSVGNSIGVDVQAFGSTIGGTSSASRNFISGNSSVGILINSNSSGALVQGNYIGTNTTGASAVANSVGVEVDGANTTIGGTTAGASNIISGNTVDGIRVGSTATLLQLQANYIGTDVTGLVALANSVGVEVQASDIIVGGTASGTANVISGNTADGVLINTSASGVQVQGNYIGTDISGTVAVGNAVGVAVEGSTNTIGGTVVGASNVISGNSGAGVHIRNNASGVSVLGNYIGTDLTGASAVSNNVGVFVQSSNNTIGGSTAAQRNIISGNTADGVLINNSVSGVSVQGNYIGTNVTGATALTNKVGVEVGTSSSAIVTGNLISGNTGTNAAGVLIDSGASGASVLGNFIGVNAAETAALANSVGIHDLGASTSIGGTTTGAGNLISGNTNQGVLMQGSAGLVLGNFIGTNPAGTAALANSIGIEVNISAPNTIGGTMIGATNVISGNSAAGVRIDNVSGVQVQGNYIGTDLTGKIALANSIGILDAGNHNTIGVSVKGGGNVISGNSNDGILLDFTSNHETLQGNYIGLNVTGKTVLANARSGIEVRGVNNTIGGVSGSNYFIRNFISGNGLDGIALAGVATGNVVQGNFIGLDISGTKAAGNVLHGIEIGGSSNTIGGTAAGVGNNISGNKHDGMLLDSTASSNAIQGNEIGTDYTGNNAVANSTNGIEVLGTGNTLGGTAAGSRNIISGNSRDGILLDSGATGNQVQGNFVGVNYSSVALANALNGIEIASNNNTIGGTNSAARNIISGNTKDGVLLGSTASGNLVLGNSIGVNPAGTAAVANHTSGIEIAGTQNTIGGAASGSRNIISGNTGDGVLLDSTASGNVVLGNLIGITSFGASVGNGSNGIEIAGTNNTLGSTIAAARNVISANSNDGVKLDSTASGNQVLGNYIGTNNHGTAAQGNKVGIEDAGNNNTLGGAVLGARNVISGNTTDGILLDSTANSESVQGNAIGLAASGTTALANGTNGIEIKGTITIGGNAQTNYFFRNFISGNANDGVLIDSGATGVQLQGNFIGLDVSGTHGVGNAANGIEIAGNSNTIGGTTFGLGNYISGNTNDGILIDSTATGNVVLGNAVGTDYTGNNAVANIANGIEVQGTGNTLGGTAAGSRNIISGNTDFGVLLDSAASGNVVLGNFIGVNLSSAALGNDFGGIEITGTQNTIGGTAGAARNIISGNNDFGVLLGSAASGNVVLGNSIGTNAAGTAAVANIGPGIEIAGTQNTIGGAASGSRNIISGNAGDGVLLDSTASGNVVLGNLIGITSFNASLGNGSNGIEVAGRNNVLGSTISAARNVISANSNAGVMLDFGAIFNQVLGNFIGTNAPGTAAQGNNVGIEDAGTNNTLGGSVIGSRNVISGNTGSGILLDGTANGESVQSNFIGLDVSGTTALANGSNGVEVKGANNTIGGNSGSNYFLRNFISGNGNDGVLIDTGASGNQVLGNFIGVDVSGTNGVGNTTNGVEIIGNNNSVGGSGSGAGNTIADNGGDGVLVSIGTGNTISRNSIFTNTGGGISLTNGGNNNLAAPTLASATIVGTSLTVLGSFTAPTANVSYVLEFFANSSGDPEGRIFLGSLTVTPTTTGAQLFTFNATTNVVGTFPLITATLTDNIGDTSIFSNGVTAS